MNENKWFTQIEQVAQRPEHHQTTENKLEADYYENIISEQSRQIKHAFEDFETDGVFDDLMSELHDAIITLETEITPPISPLNEKALDKLYTMLTSKVAALETSVEQDNYHALQSLARSLFTTTLESPTAYNKVDTETMDQASLEHATYESEAFEEFAERMKVVTNQIDLSFDEYQAHSAYDPESTLLRHVRRICESIAYEWQRLPNEDSTHTSEARSKAYPLLQQTTTYLGEQINKLEQRADASKEVLDQLKRLFEQAYQPPAWLSQDDPGSSNKED